MYIYIYMYVNIHILYEHKSDTVTACDLYIPFFIQTVGLHKL